MKIEVLIYAYLAVCAAMIGFNIVCSFVFRAKDKRLDRYSRRFMKKVSKAMEEQTVPDRHRKYLSRKMKRLRNLMAFDKTLEQLYAQDPGQAEAYIRQLLPVFARLTLVYGKKPSVQAAYFPYLLKKYRIFYGQPMDIVTDTLLQLVRSPSLYVRENALQAIYSIGSTDCAVNALFILDECRCYHHPKMITDGLLCFAGDARQLGEQLWACFPRFSSRMQLIIVDYFRFSSPEYGRQILALLTADPIEEELAFRCIRYFGKYAYGPAYPVLMALTEKYRGSHWIYTAILASALVRYPADQTVAVLKELLHHPNWHVRFNASQSLIDLGLFYTDMIDVFEGQDRYAGEIMRYRFDQRKMKEKEACGVGLVSQ